MKALAFGLGLVGVWYFFVKPAQASGDTIVKIGTHTWIVRTVETQIGGTTSDVFAPAGSWGPHAEMRVLRFTKTVAPGAQRVLAGVGEGVPAAMSDAAIADLAISVPGRA